VRRLAFCKESNTAYKILLIFGRLYSALTVVKIFDQWLSQNEALVAGLRVSDLFTDCHIFSYFFNLEKPHWIGGFQILMMIFSFFSLAIKPTSL